MIQKKRLIYNTFLLTGVSLLMSCIGIAFQVWLVGRIGSAGIGLYQLVLSVTGLAMTFAISGIRFASTRLISEELGALNCAGIRAAMRRCLGYALFFGLAAGLILWTLAEPIGFLWIGDARTVRSLRLSAVSMPCAALCAALSGYFTACGRVWKPSAVHLAEQLVGIALVALCLARPHGGYRAELRGGDARARDRGCGVAHADAGGVHRRQEAALRRVQRRAAPHGADAENRAAAGSVRLCAQRADNAAKSARPARSEVRRVLCRRRACGLRDDTGHGAADHLLPVVHHVRRGGAHRAGADGGAGAGQPRGHTRRGEKAAAVELGVFRRCGAFHVVFLRYAGLCRV